MVSQKKFLAPRNRSLAVTEQEKSFYKSKLINLNKLCTLNDIIDKTINQDLFKVLQYLPDNSIDLLFADPPYNLSKTFNEHSFSKISLEDYENWLDSWLGCTVRLLKPTASIYICGDWRSSAAIHRVGAKYFQVQNRITWEREKGRGAKNNWKNCSEDIWYFTKSHNYIFNLESVKLKRQVIAPYTNENGQPKDWESNETGRFRLTHPSNLWTDITVPFWSMPENTEHPTQKPEKLLAKLILASSNEGDLILDPFLGSGTTSVVAKKLNRHFIGIEIDEHYCCIAEKRLEIVNKNKDIQGYSDGVFWERNSLAQQNKKTNSKKDNTSIQYSLL